MCYCNEIAVRLEIQYQSSNSLKIPTDGIPSQSNLTISSKMAFLQATDKGRSAADYCVAGSQNTANTQR